MNNLRLTIAFFVLASFGLPSVVSAVGERLPEARIFNATTGEEEIRFPVLDGKFKGGVSVATGDVDGDGVDEIVVGAGPGGGPTVMVYEKDGRRVSNFMAYDANTKKGVSLAVGDMDGDLREEIWTVPMMGQAHVRAFDGSGTPLFTTKGFFAFPDWMKGGASLAIGDVQGDGVREVYVSAGSVTTGHIRSFSRTGSVVGWTLMPFGTAHQGGAVVRLADVDLEKGDEVIAGNYDQGETRVKVFREDGSVSAQWLAFGTYPVGVRLATGDMDGDGKAEIVTGVGRSGGPQVRVFQADGKLTKSDFFAYESDFRGGVNVAVGNVDSDSDLEIVVTPARMDEQAKKDREAFLKRDPSHASYLGSVGKLIEVDLSEQRLYAFKDGKVDRSFLVSTGVNKYPTTQGVFSVTQKIPIMDYQWEYGPNHPDNYNIKDVRWNLRFNGPELIHYAYWHNNFGRKMSHGCVNVGKDDAIWIFSWAEVGTPVIVHE
jgi:hypothetical protein